MLWAAKKLPTVAWCCVYSMVCFLCYAVPPRPNLLLLFIALLTTHHVLHRDVVERLVHMSLRQSSGQELSRCRHTCHIMTQHMRKTQRR
jgi:hypothetical protein